jgi:hypothetical protein
MKKSNMLIAVFAVLAAASTVANAEDVKADFNGGASGGISVARALAVSGLDGLEIPIPPQAVPVNVKDICSKMSVGHGITIPVCVSGYLGEEAGIAAIGGIQREWDKQALPNPDLVTSLETIAAGKNVIVKYDGKRLFLKKVSSPDRWVDGNPATSWHPDVTPVEVAVPTHTVGEALAGGFGGFASGPATAIAGALAGAVHGFVQDVYNYADHGNTNDED